MNIKLCVWLIASSLLPCCAGTSINADIARARELGRIDMELPVAAEVEPLAEGHGRELLTKPLDANAAVRVALLNNRELRAQLRDMGVERGQLMQAGMVANPLFEIEVLPERNSALELRVEYEITSLILAPVRANAAVSDLEAARCRVAGAIVQLGFDVRAAFYALQAAQMRLEIAQRSLDAFAASSDAAEALLNAGNIRQLDASQQQLAYERAKVSVAVLELDNANAFERLQRLLGLQEADSAWTIAGALQAAPAELVVQDKLETVALEASLDMNETRQRLEGIARKAGYSALRGWLPEIDADVHALVGDPQTGGIGANASWRFGGGVSVRLPLFDQRRGITRTLEAQRDALLERYHGQAIALRSLVREARNNLKSAHARALRFQTTVLPLQARVFDHTLKQYNAMQVSVFQLLAARREQLDVELDQVATLAEYWTARAAMDAVLAGKQVTSRAPVASMSVSAGDSSGGH